MFTLLSSFLVINFTSGVCPDSNLLKPCNCFDDYINCGGNEDIDLVKIFETLGKKLPKTGKHFHNFYLNNTFITELKENTFSDITFTEIFIKGCSKLKTIHKNAFNTTDQVTTELHFDLNPALTSPDNTIFEVLNKFARAEFITMNDNNITEIPTKAFKNKQDHLTYLYIKGKSIQKLGNNAFSGLKGLFFLSLESTSIELIPENAFEFNEESNKTLLVDLTKCKFLNSTGFSVNSLIKFKRPAEIILDMPKDSAIQYLNQKIFEPFLLSKVDNKIHIGTGSFNCDDCRNYWLKRNPNLLKQLVDTRCTNGRTISDSVNFKNCSS